MQNNGGMGMPNNGGMPAQGYGGALPAQGGYPPIDGNAAQQYGGQQANAFPPGYGQGGALPPPMQQPTQGFEGGCIDFEKNSHLNSLLDN